MTVPAATAGTFDGIVQHFAHVDASRTLVAVLPLLSRPGQLAPPEEAAARFLAASAFAELGFDEPALEELDSLLGAPSRRLGGGLAAPAVIALARIHARRGEDLEVLRLARAAPWEEFSREDAAELAYRAGVSAFRLGRHAEVADWIERVPEGSPYSPFAALLAAQADFTLGRYGRAVAAATAAAREGGEGPEGVLLRERAAIFAGEIYTELGSYELAVSALARAPLRGAYAARAKRDLLVAQALARLARGDLEGGRRTVAELGALFERLAEGIEAAVASDRDVAARGRELRRVWPARSAVYRRRAWAEERLRGWLDSRAGPLSRPGGLAGSIVFVKVPAPFRWLGSDGERPERELPGPRLSPATRPFFPPAPQTAALLEALSLLEERPARWGESCSIRAATAIRRRVAAWRLGDTARPGIDELRALASSCEEPSPDEGLRQRAEAALVEAIRTQARRLEEGFRRQALELELAIGRAQVRETAALAGVRRSVSMQAAAPVAAAAP